MTTAPKRSRATVEQLGHMVDFFASNPGLAEGKFQKLHGKVESEKKWSELTISLNSLGGAVKTVEQWHTVWRDLKSRTSIKVRERKKQEAMTGNRPIKQEPITELEKKIISIIGKEYIEGNINVKENVPLNDDLQVLLEDDEENIILEMSSSDTSELLPETPKSIRNTPRKSTKRKRAGDDETRDKFLEIAERQADALKMLAESNRANVEAIKMMADAIKIMGEGLKSTAEAFNNLANAINKI